MKKQISHISVLQTSKILTLFVVLPMIVIFWIMALFTLLSGVEGGLQAALVLIFGPFVYALFIFIFYIIWLWIYNVIARAFGGIEINLEDMGE